MTALKTRRTLSSLLIGSLLLCAAPQTASSQQNADGAKQAEQMFQTCLTAPAQQALRACQQLATVLSLVPDTPVDVRIRFNARFRNVLVELGRFAEAEAPARSAVAAALESKERPAIGAQQNGLATVLQYLGRYSEAEELFRSATELAKKEYGAEALQVAAAMGNLAVVLQYQGKLTEAESLFRKSLAIGEKKLEPDHPSLATTLGNLAGVLQDQGKLTEAESLFRKSLAIKEKKLEPDHPSLATTLGNLALVLTDQGKLTEAESLYRKSLAILEKKLEPDHPSLATTLGNLAVVLQYQGKLTEAESLFRKSLAIGEKKLEPDHPSLATTLGNLAGALQDQGKLTEAESLYRKSLAILEKKLEPDHPLIATTLGNLAGVLQDQGKLTEAESLYRKSLAIREKKLEPDHPLIATTLGNLAGVLYLQGKLTEAESLYRKSLAIREKKLEPDHPLIATTLGNLAGVLYLQGKLTEAESLYRKSLAIREKKLEPDHPLIATTLGNLAGVLKDQGKLTEAESLFRKSLAIQEKKLEPDHPSLAKSHFNLALLRLARGEIKGAVAEQQKSIQGFDQQLRTSLTEDQAEALLTTNSAGENFVYGLPLLSGAPPEAGRLAMSTALLFKGRTLEAGRMVRRKLQQGLKTEAQKQKYQTMVELLGRRDQELSLLGQGSGQRDKAQQLLWQAQKLERELSKEVGVVSGADVPTLENVTQKVAQALRTDSDAVLVEVGLAMTADYSRGSNMEIGKTGAFHYVAMMLFPSGEVRVVKLGGKDEVESVAATFLAALNSGSKDMKAVAQAAYSALFAPLEKKLGGATRIILSPDGALSAIPFAALHDDKGYLVERLSFRYVSSGRDLLNVPSQQPTGQPAVMMATRVPGQNPLPDAEQTGRELAQMQRAKLTTGATDGQVLAQQSPSVLTLISHGYFRAETKTYGMSAKLPTAPKQLVRPKYMNQMAFERDSPA